MARSHQTVGSFSTTMSRLYTAIDTPPLPPLALLHTVAQYVHATCLMLNYNLHDALHECIAHGHVHARCMHAEKPGRGPAAYSLLYIGPCARAPPIGMSRVSRLASRSPDRPGPGISASSRTHHQMTAHIITALYVHLHSTCTRRLLFTAVIEYHLSEHTALSYKRVRSCKPNTAKAPTTL